jgi:hypothetical protein
VLALEVATDDALVGPELGNDLRVEIVHGYILLKVHQDAPESGPDPTP